MVSPKTVPAVTSSQSHAIKPVGQHYSNPVFSSPIKDEGFTLQRFFQILRRRQRTFVASTLLVSIASTSWLAYQRLVNPVYQGSFSMLISDPVNPTSGASASGLGGVGAIGAVALNRTGVDLPTLIQVLESPVVLEPVRNQIAQQWPGQLSPAIKVVPVGSGSDRSSTGVLDIMVSGNNPAVISSTLEVAQKVYLSWALTQRRERLQQAVEFLGEQAPELEAKAARLQNQVEDFRLRNRLLVPDNDAAVTRSQVETLSTQLVQQQSEIERLERLRSDVAAGKLVTSSFTSQASDTGSQTSVALTVPDQAQLAELERLDSQIAEARSRFVPGNPVLSQLENARAILVPQIQRTQLQAINAALNQFRNQTQSLKTQISSLEVRFESQPGLMKEFANLQQKLLLAEENLQSYVRAREQFQLEIAQNTPPWRVISPATINPNPVEPSIPQGLLRALMLGLLAGSGAALLREKTDYVFHSPSEVEEDLGESLLGHIPYIEIFEGVRADKRFVLEMLDGEDSRLSRFQKFQYQEAFRNLATSIRFLSTDKPVRSIAISSSIPSEGKSLLVVLFSKTLSELGQRVLLVDTDMRKPQMHHRLGVDNVSGLSNLLTDEGLDWRSVVVPVANHTGWDLITAGRQPPDPPRLLSSQRMHQLMLDLRDNGGYDLIIFDTPPALGLADAALVAEHIDGLLMLVSLRRVPRDLPKLAIRRIREAGAPVLGIITNSRQLRRDGNDTVAYGGYGYGGVGQEGYTYQSYANDPLLAYSYYQAKDAPKPAPAPKRGLKKFLPSPSSMRAGLRRISGRINSWLDE